MRIALALAFITGTSFAAQPFHDEAKAHHWRMLDASPRARGYASWATTPVTEAEFRTMQQHYRPQTYDVWMRKIRQLRSGMTEKQVLAILQPKEPPLQMYAGAGIDDVITLDDAYFVDVFVTAWPHRMTSATTPLARTYEIKPSRKAQRKT